MIALGSGLRGRIARITWVARIAEEVRIMVCGEPGVSEAPFRGIVLSAGWKVEKNSG